MALVAWMPGAPPEVEAPLRRALGPGVALRNEASDAEPPNGVRVLISGTPDAALLAALPDLEAVLIPYAGVPPRTASLLAEHPALALYNLHHNAAPTAELALTLLLSVWKDMARMGEPLRAGDWRARYAEPTARTVAGRRVMILGYGAIGQRLAAALLALECEVVGVRRHSRRPAVPAGVRIVGMDAWRDELADVDALVVALPRTADTEGLVGESVLAALPAGAVLVNVGRGRVVDEQALHGALTRGHLAGAGLDVWWRYPRSEDERSDCPPGETNLHRLEQVVVSPHRAGLTQENEAQRAAAIADFLEAFRCGGPLPGRVDPRLGY